MKGVVFTEFLDMVDSAHSMELAERLVDETDLPSSGAYTSVGTYDPAEMVALVGKLSEITETPVSELLRQFGRHLFGRFATLFPDFFEGKGSAFEFLPAVDEYVHIEVAKLYENAELPSFECILEAPHRLRMIYSSKRSLEDFAEGLILGCLDHYGEAATIERETLPGPPPRTAFIIVREG